MAGALSEVDDEVLEFDLEEGDSVLEEVGQQIDTTTLRRLRKITEVLEDDLGLNLGHGKFTRIASTAATANSIVAIAVAGWNLVESADTLQRASQDAESLQKVKQKRFDTFYKAVGLFVLECFLFATPFSYRTAWRGTRYLNNRYLHRLRSMSRILYRLTLSEVHYAIRGFTKEALRNVDQLTSYLAEVTVSSIEILREHSDSGIDDLVGTVQQEVEEFHAFVQEIYDFAIPEIDLQSIVQEVIAEISGIMDVSSSSVE
ncbi:hypothetical protein GOC74_09950 [Halomicrobium mukohataei]|uniref:Uncharacterized protein n=1 Tax=Halomicrobium mukohataei TaxID=57705 RepID=A0A847UGC1_9EURY|nr:hypothetical protein [Halomicrobium mukohataei]